PMLMDFGLARSLREDLKQITSRPLGTPAYMPPEQFSVDPSHIGPAMDVYSLGVVFYELLTGQLPFEADHSWALLNQILNVLPPRPSSLRADLAPELEAVCLKALAKKPEDRFADMTALATALGKFLAPHPAPSPEAVVPARVLDIPDDLPTPETRSL